MGTAVCFESTRVVKMQARSQSFRNARHCAIAGLGPVDDLLGVDCDPGWREHIRDCDRCGLPSALGAIR
jgi:hypothetical protein